MHTFRKLTRNLHSRARAPVLILPPHNTPKLRDPQIVNTNILEPHASVQWIPRRRRLQPTVQSLPIRKLEAPRYQGSSGAEAVVSWGADEGF